jgi:mannose-6-phosphate isomerase
MNALYPLKFIPIYKERIWGGNKLKQLLNKDFSPLANCGESWELSGVQDDVSVVANGFLKGNTLEEIIEVYMGDLVGEKVYDQFGTEFPLLIKYIDANDNLSIQVHPDDELSRERHGAYGKTEMWYVVQSDEGSELISGFNRKIDRDSYLIAFENGQLEALLNKEAVSAGNVFFMPAGRVHAIGKGIVVAEIQQTSDVTYRIFDFNRVDAKGNPRELHTDLALDAIDFKFEENYRTKYEPKDNEPVQIAECKYFTTNVLYLNKTLERDFRRKDTFVIYMCIEGNALIRWEEKTMEIRKGETVLVPASLESFVLEPDASEKAHLLEVYI